MKTLAFVDCQNLFYGIKRITGIPSARMDYGKLRDTFRTSPDDLFLAYVVSLTNTPASNSAFVSQLGRLGYSVRIHYGIVRADDDGGVSFDRTRPDREMYFDALRYIPTGEYDRVLIVSGAGSVLSSVVTRAIEHKVPVTVAAFVRSGDLNSELADAATEVVPLDAGYVYNQVRKGA